MKSKISILLLTAFCFVSAQCEKPLGIHSHNDYNNPEPLFYALENCVKSIEADIHLVDDEIFVAHDLNGFDHSRTLVNLYLEPISEIFENQKSKYNYNYELYLLIDIKSNAESTFQVLNEKLKKYDKYLTYYQDGNIYKRKIRVILSGNRPVELVKSMERRSVFLDGRLTDINKNYSSELFPLISASKNQVQEYLEIYNDDCLGSEEFTDLVSNIHNENKCFRIWGMPDNAVSWAKQLEQGVDLINTDNVEELSLFFTNNK